MAEKILLVDDDASVRYTVEEVMQAEGLSILTARSGEDCLRKLRNGFRGVILLDIMMPEMNGWQTLANIRNEGLLDGNIICMLTAVVNPGTEMEELKECVLDYVRKPFQPDNLVETAREYLSYLEPIASE
jgi:CheY-like chemotaxis protein